jgi:hypothetical protein
MGGFVKGDIVIIPFPFSDLSGSKKRPAFLAANLIGDDIIVCQITSKSKSDPPPKRLLAGFDNLGNALELIAIEDDERDCLIVIHAMELRRQFYYLLEGN